MAWISTPAYLTYNQDKLSGRPIAAFDLDDTLIKPSMCKKFSEGRDDWMLYDPSIPQLLSNYKNKGYDIVIISNQNGIQKGKIKCEDWQGKIEDFIKLTGIDIIVFASIDDGPYRKPRTGIWDTFIAPLLNDTSMNGSFYCGDAGGLGKRTIKGQSIYKDFSDTDLKFARNLGLKFIHRDEFVYGVQYGDDKYTIKYDFDLNQIIVGQQPVFKPHGSLEMIINIGYPASGKTSYTKRHILSHGYLHINQDTLGTQPKCIKAVDAALKNGTSCVVDNTNMTTEYRKKYIDIGKKYGAHIRCIIFTTSMEQSIHNNIFRNYITNGEIDIIPDIVYFMMRKKIEVPTFSEGMNEIIEIPFIFDDPTNLQIYRRYYY